jgi:hypothetical protein
MAQNCTQFVRKSWYKYFDWFNFENEQVDPI